MKKHVIGGLLVSLCFSIQAEVLEIWNFTAIDGDYQNNVALFESAKAIQEKAGAKVEYWQHDINGDNIISYVARFKDTAAWAMWKDALMADESWLNWINSSWPKARPHLANSYAMNNLLNPAAGTDIADGINVSYMSAWQPSEDSNNMLLMASIQKSAAISEKFGLQTDVYINGPSGIFYIFSGGSSWADVEAKLTKRNASAEWQEYWSNAQIKRAGQFVQQAWITRLTVD